MPGVVWRRLLGRRPVPPHPDDAAIAALYQAIRDETGVALIVDSSKLPPYGLLLSHLPQLEVTVLHLVRDPRATAFSWRRRKPSRDRDDDALMPRQPVWKSTMLWLIWNMLAAVFWRPVAGSHMRLRYEDLVADPRGTTERICRTVGLPMASLPFIEEHVVDLLPIHAVAGNPVRRSSGPVEIRPDDEWRQRMSSRDRRAVTALTAPALAAFGYRFRAPGAPSRLKRAAPVGEEPR
jgi:hypothetical protein